MTLGIAASASLVANIARSQNNESDIELSIQHVAGSVYMIQRDPTRDNFR